MRRILAHLRLSTEMPPAPAAVPAGPFQAPRVALTQSRPVNGTAQGSARRSNHRLRYKKSHLCPTDYEARGSAFWKVLIPKNMREICRWRGSGR